MKQLTKEQLKEIINKQMEINGYKERFEDIEVLSKKGKKWYQMFLTTPIKEEEFRQWLDNYLKEKLHIINPFIREKEIDWIILNYGLKVKEE